MIAVTNKVYSVFFSIVLTALSGMAYSQNIPITGTVTVDLGVQINATIGSQINIPVNIDLTNVSATDINGGSVNAVLGNYRIAVSYDNTQLSALVNTGFIDGGTTAEFSNAVTANVITNGTNDLLILNASQLDINGPLGQVNVAQIPFNIVSLSPGAAALSVSIIDLRTPIIVTGQVEQPIIGGASLPFQTFDTQINVQAAVDADGDGLPDAWEQLYGFIVGVDESTFDNDFDGLSNLEEYLNNTSPINIDSDGDLVPDGYEVANNNDPADINDFPLWITSQPVVTGNVESQYLYQIIANKPSITYGLTTLPPGMLIHPISGLITWSINEDQSGMHDVTVEISGNNETAEQVFTITIAGSGDVNGDGSINAADYLLLQQHVLGTRVLTLDQQARADLYVNEVEDVINIQDLILLGRKVLGL